MAVNHTPNEIISILSGVLHEFNPEQRASIVRTVNSHEVYERLKEEMMSRIENKEGFDPHELEAWIKIIKKAEGK